MAHDAVVSYSSKDQAVADAVVKSLEYRGIKCWISSRDVRAGADWAASIIEAVDSCRVLVLILTTNSNDSPHVAREVERAISRKTALVPLRVGSPALSRSMQYYVGVRQWLDASNPPTDAQLRTLAQAVEDVLATGAVPDDLGRTRVKRNRGWAVAAILSAAVAAGYLLYHFAIRPQKIPAQPLASGVTLDSTRQPASVHSETSHRGAGTEVVRTTSSPAEGSSGPARTTPKSAVSGSVPSTRDTSFGDLRLQFWSDRGPTPSYIGGETLGFVFSASRDCYVYVIYISADGSIGVIVPPARTTRTATLYRGGKSYRIPQDIEGSFDLIASPPFGKDVVKAIASTERLDSLVLRPGASSAGAARLVSKLRTAAAGGGYAERSLILTTTEPR